MTFFRSIVMLASVILLVAFAYFVGYGLALHRTMPMVWGVVLLAAGVGLVFLQTRIGRKA